MDKTIEEKTEQEIVIKDADWWMDQIARFGGDPYYYAHAYRSGEITTEQLKQAMFEDALMMVEGGFDQEIKDHQRIETLVEHIAGQWATLVRSKIVKRNFVDSLIKNIEVLLNDDSVNQYLEAKLLEKINRGL